MNDLEDRLRTSLREAADTVPASQHARADFELRQSGHRRRPALAVAAAAVVVAAVAVPVAMNQNGSSGPISPGAGTSQPGPPPDTSGPAPLAGPVQIASYADGGVEKFAVFSVVQEGEGERFCVAEAAPHGKEQPGLSASCGTVPARWPVEFGPDFGPGTLVLTRSVLGGDTLYSGPLPNLLLFVTAPQVTTLEVREGYGQPVRVDQLAKTAGAAFYLAHFPETYAGFGYTAKDAAGNVLANAIT